MATWPDLGQLKQVLGVTTDARDAVLADALAASVEQVQQDVGASEPIVDPTSSLAQAALVLAVMVAKAPDAPFGVAAVFDTGGLTVAANHPTYLRLLVGQRERWPVA